MDFGKWILCDQPYGKLIIISLFVAFVVCWSLTRKLLSKTSYFKKPNSDSNFMPMTKDEIQKFNRRHWPYQFPLMVGFSLFVACVFWGIGEIWFSIRFSDELIIAISKIAYFFPAVLVGICLATYFTRLILHRRHRVDFLRFQESENTIYGVRTERTHPLMYALVSLVALVIFFWMLWATTVLEGGQIVIRKFGSTETRVKLASEISGIRTCESEIRSGRIDRRHLVFFKDGTYWRLDDEVDVNRMLDRLSKVSGVIPIKSPWSDCGCNVCEAPRLTVESARSE